MYLVMLSLTTLLLSQATQPASQPALAPVTLLGPQPARVHHSYRVPDTLLASQISSEVTPVTDEEFKHLLERLKHPRYGVRQKAIGRLQQVRGQRLPALVRRYRSETSFEVKRALRGVIEHLFYRGQIVGERGFLGIQPIPVKSVIDPENGATLEAMRVAKVIEEHAAHRAGMKEGDLIVSYDGEAMSVIYKTPLPPQPDTEKLARQQGRRVVRSADKRIDAFTQKVKTTEPGREIPVRVLRPVPTSIELVGQDAVNAQAFLKAFRYAGSAEGFVVREVDADSPAEAIGLIPGDVVVKVNGQSVSSRKKDKPIEDALAEVKPPEPLVLSVIRMVLKEVRLTVVLGTRPMNMINPADELILKDRFARWWIEQEGEMVYTPSRRNAGWVYSQTTTQPAPETDLLP